MDAFEECYRKLGLTWEGAMAHAKELARRASEMVARDASWHPVAIILTPDAGAVRDALPRLLQHGIAKPDDWVPLLVSREQALEMLRADAPATVAHLEPEGHGRQRRLPVVVVTAIGMRLGHEPYEVTPVPMPGGGIPCTVHAMLICSQAFQQAVSGKWCVIGTHDGVRVPRVPAMHQFAVFLSLGDFRSGSRLQILVRHDEHRDDVLCRVDAEALLDEPFGSLNLGVPFPPLRLPYAGRYEIELLAGNRPIAARHLVVQVEET